MQVLTTNGFQSLRKEKDIGAKRMRSSFRKGSGKPSNSAHCLSNKTLRNGFSHHIRGQQKGPLRHGRSFTATGKAADLKGPGIQVLGPCRKLLFTSSTNSLGELQSSEGVSSWKLVEAKRGGKKMRPDLCACREPAR